MPRRLGDLVADGRDRVEGAEGVLEDDRHAPALAVAASSSPHVGREGHPVHDDATRGEAPRCSAAGP